MPRGFLSSRLRHSPRCTYGRSADLSDRSTKPSVEESCGTQAMRLVAWLPLAQFINATEMFGFNPEAVASYLHRRSFMAKPFGLMHDRRDWNRRSNRPFFRARPISPSRPGIGTSQREAILSLLTSAVPAWRDHLLAYDLRLHRAPGLCRPALCPTAFGRRSDESRKYSSLPAVIDAMIDRLSRFDIYAAPHRHPLLNSRFSAVNHWDVH